jgi:hypothetical protein
VLILPNPADFVDKEVTVVGKGIEGDPYLDESSNSHFCDFSL